MKQKNLEIVDGVEWCLCSACGTKKICELNFYYDKRHNYFTNVCRLCMNAQKRDKNYIPKYPPGDILQSKQVLRLIGYDPDSKIPVHEQFNLKHDL
jgi:hypothetical protein